MKTKSAIAMGAMVLSSPLTLAAPDMNEGQWEITSKMEMPGMPMQMPVTTITQCITKENNVPKSGDQGGGCRMVDVKTSGNTVSWSMACDQSGQESTGHGEVTYSGDTMNGFFKFFVNSPQGTMEMTNTMNGRRVGPCK